MIDDPVAFIVKEGVGSICHARINRDTFGEIVKFCVVHIDGYIDRLRSASTTQDALEVVNLALQCGKVRIFDPAFTSACTLADSFLASSNATLEEHGKRRHREKRAHHAVMFEIDGKFVFVEESELALHIRKANIAIIGAVEHVPSTAVGGVVLRIHRRAEALCKHEHLHFEGGGFGIFVIVIQKRICATCRFFMRLRFETHPLYRGGNFVRKRRFARSDVAFSDNYAIFYCPWLTAQKDAQSSDAILSIIVLSLSAPNATKIGFTPYLASAENSAR